MRMTRAPPNPIVCTLCVRCGVRWTLFCRRSTSLRSISPPSSASHGLLDDVELRVDVALPRVRPHRLLPAHPPRHLHLPRAHLLGVAVRLLHPCAHARGPAAPAVLPPPRLGPVAEAAHPPFDELLACILARLFGLGVEGCVRTER